MSRTTDDIQAIMIERTLRRELPDYVLEHLNTALTLDASPGDATRLLVATPNEWRGGIVLLLYHRRSPISVFRQALDDCWNHDHDVLVSTVRNRAKLRGMFRRAAFQIPTGPDVVRVWRGTSNCTLTRARAGLSWTTDRATACWFATTYRKGLGNKPLVLKMDAPRSAFFYHSDERQEAELLCFDARLHETVVDGEATEWWETGRDLEARREAERLKDFASLLK
ncbi:MAG: hypothetical protein ACRYHQ_04340 [Janthinobacterium lividum]